MRAALLFLASCIALPLQDKHLLDAIDHLKAELDELSSQAERSTVQDPGIIEQNRLYQIAQESVSRVRSQAQPQMTSAHFRLAATLLVCFQCRGATTHQL